MGGLLYKEFVAVRGKRIVNTIGIATLFFILLRVYFSGDRMMEDFCMENGDGDLVNLVDLILSQAVWWFLIMSLYAVNRLGIECVRSDDKNKIRGYIAALPLEKNTYLASKYVFLGIAAYVLLSMFFMWEIVCAAFIHDSFNQDFLQLSLVFAFPGFSMAILLAAVEMPMFLLLGEGVAAMIKVGVGLGIALLVIYFFLFGNPEILERIDFMSIQNWVNAHEFGLTLVGILSPMISLACYYVSYRISCAFYQGGENDYE